MPSLQISKSIDIEAPAPTIYEKLNDFNHWRAWSPWLIQDPATSVDVASDSKSYSWEGKRTGSGNMIITAEKQNNFIDYDLNFLKPWKSKASVKFELKENGSSTEVTWYMDSNLPFFMFWMKKMMTAVIGMDYQRGLLMLKDYAEKGKVESELDFKGISDFQGFKYIGIRTVCTMATVGPKMSDDLKSLGEYISDKKDLVAAQPFSIYEKWDPVKDKIIYTSGIPVSALPDGLPSGYITGEIPATKVYTLRHIGPYKHLGNAWTTLYGMQRGKEFKMNKKIFPFETYINSPYEVADSDLITEVHFPVK